MSLRLIDLNGNHYMIEGTSTLDETLNGDESLTLEINDSRVNREITSQISESWRVSGVKGSSDLTEYVVKRKTVTAIGKFKKITINAVPLFIEKMNTKRLYTLFTSEDTIETVLNRIFPSFIGFTYNLDSSLTFSADDYMTDYGDGVTFLEIFKDVLEKWQLEFEVVGTVVNIKKLITREPDYFISNEINASNVQQEIDGTSFGTYIKGYADLADGDPLETAGESTEYTHPLAQVTQIGIKDAPPYRTSDVLTKAQLEARLKKYLDATLKVSTTCDFISLQKRWPTAVPRLGDIVMFIATNIDYKQRLKLISISTKRNHFGDIITQSVTFGDAPLKVRHKADINHATQYVKDLANARRRLPQGALDKATQLASSLILAAKTELDFTSSLGIVARDKTDANNIVVLNSAGLGVSNDGGKSFGNAVTGAGINATMITTGTMIADRIMGGILKDFWGNFEWNLNTGEFFIGSSKIVYKNYGNALVYGALGNACGVTFSKEKDSDYPVVVVGTSPNIGTDRSPTLDSNSTAFTGMRAFNNGISGNKLELIGDHINFRSVSGDNMGYSLSLKFKSGVASLTRSSEQKFTIGEKPYKINGLYSVKLNDMLIGDTELWSPDGKHGFTFADGDFRLIYDNKAYSVKDIINNANFSA